MNLNGTPGEEKKPEEKLLQTINMSQPRSDAAYPWYQYAMNALPTLLTQPNSDNSPRPAVDIGLVEATQLYNDLLAREKLRDAQSPSENGRGDARVAEQPTENVRAPACTRVAERPTENVQVPAFAPKLEPGPCPLAAHPYSAVERSFNWSINDSRDQRKPAAEDQPMDWAPVRHTLRLWSAGEITMDKIVNHRGTPLLLDVEGYSTCPFSEFQHNELHVRKYEGYLVNLSRLLDKWQMSRVARGDHKDGDMQCWHEVAIATAQFASDLLFVRPWLDQQGKLQLAREVEDQQANSGKDKKDDTKDTNRKAPAGVVRTDGRGGRGAIRGYNRGRYPGHPIPNTRCFPNVGDTDYNREGFGYGNYNSSPGLSIGHGIYNSNMGLSIGHGGYNSSPGLSIPGYGGYNSSPGLSIPGYGDYNSSQGLSIGHGIPSYNSNMGLSIGHGDYNNRGFSHGHMYGYSPPACSDNPGKKVTQGNGNAAEYRPSGYQASVQGDADGASLDKPKTLEGKSDDGLVAKVPNGVVPAKLVPVALGGIDGLGENGDGCPL